MTYSSKITVYARTPARAHHFLKGMPDDTPTRKISQHVPTERGWRNAYRRACEVVAEYHRNYGDEAAVRVWAEYNGRTYNLYQIEEQTW